MNQPSTPTQKQKPRRLTRTLIGVVTSDRRDKTRTVVVSYLYRHPKYGKYLRRETKYHVHDPENASHVGDRVEIAPCRPISKTKSWRLVRILEKAATAAETTSQPAGESAPSTGS